MKRLHLFTFPLVCAILLITISFFLGSTQEVLTYEEPQLVVSEFMSQEVTAHAYSVIAIETGEVLTTKNEAEILPIASVTKLVTAAMLLGEDGIETKSAVTVRDTDTEGRAGKLVVGQQYSPRELLSPLLLESSNDAGATLLRLYPNLVDTMNSYSLSIGLTKTQFVDTTGLSQKNVTTAQELSLLLSSLYKRERHVFDLTTQKESFGVYTGWMNNNPISGFAGFLGGKHGFTEASGRTLASVFTETLASGEQIEVGYVLLKSVDLKKDIQLLREGVAKNVSYK